MITSIEQHVDWIFDCLDYLDANGIKLIEPDEEYEKDWVQHNQDMAKPHIRSSCSSWYKGSNVEGKPEVFLPYIGGFPAYVKKCEEISKSGYKGFLLTK
jgi:cyclohexanone monooxygenase